jgi:hypothetical protein
LGNLKKHYIGSISTEDKAARIYDRHAILTHGLRAKTNFSYTKQQILMIIEKEEEEDPAFDESMHSQKDQNTNDEDSAFALSNRLNTIETLRPDFNASQEEIIKSEEGSPSNY